MSKYVKGLLQKEIEQKFSEVSDFLVLDTRGISGNENNELRGILNGKGIHLTVVKNVLMRRALEGKDMSSATSLFLTGPCTVAYGGDSVVDIAKECAEWSKKVECVQFKGAFVDGLVMDAEEAEALAKLPSRSELQGMILVLAQSPGATLAGAVAGPGGVIAGCIKTIVDNLEDAA